MSGGGTSKGENVRNPLIVVSIYHYTVQQQLQSRGITGVEETLMKTMNKHKPVRHDHPMNIHDSSAYTSRENGV